MIRIYDGEHGLEIDDHADIDDVLEVMEKLDEVYKHRSEIVSDLITIHKDILFYSLLYIIDNINHDSMHIIKEGIKYWDNFSKEQQKEFFEKLLSNYENKELVDNEIQSWIESIKLRN